MKFAKLLLVVACALACPTVWGQITLKEKKAPLEKVLADIEKQTKFVFLYDPDVVKTAPITISIKNATLEETLTQLFRDLPIQYTLVDNNVLLKSKPTTNPQPNPDITIHGRVVDSAGQPIEAVTILNTRARKATATDTTGAYTLKASKGDILRFSFVGYKDREITIGDQPLINLNLEANLTSGDEVVVIGYGSSKKKDLTGAVSIVEIRDFGTTPYNTFDNALAGKAAGVDVTKSDGTPGGMVRIRIRGLSSLIGGNDPLYVIDGIPVQVRNNFIDPGFQVSSPMGNLVGSFGGLISSAAFPISFVNGLNSLGGLNPDDIASITVLKDASSTAIYGSKGANGIVIITTKSGITNTPARVAFNDYTTVSSPYMTPKLLNASQYKMLLSEAARNTMNEDSAFGSPSDLATSILDSPAYFGAANTDWIRKVTRTTVSNNVGVSVSGGGTTSKYFSSLSYSSAPGVVDATHFQRISGKLNLETQITSKIRFGTNLMLGYTDQAISAGAYPQALLARPDWAPRNPTGSYTDFSAQDNPYGELGFLNPVALLTATNSGQTLSLLGSFWGSYSISKDFHFRSAVSLHSQNYNQVNYLPSYIEVSDNGYNSPNESGIGSNANSRFADWFLENTLNYTKQFNHHAFNVIIGQSYETTKFSYFRATATGYPNNTTLTGLSSASTPLSITGDDPSSPQSYLLSFYARGNYTWQDKYLFTFTERADGSSKFGPTDKYGYFPSGAIAWRISRENFLKSVDWINDIKLRASYGLTGNQNIGDQMYRTLYSPVTYAGSNVLIPTQLGNQGIKWESTKETDIGLDLSFFADRLSTTVDYYNRQTNGALLWLPTPASSSYLTLLQNAVGLRNRGFEVSVGGTIIRDIDFAWTASINVTWNSSLVTKLDPKADLEQITSPSGFETVATSTNELSGNTSIIQGKPLGLISGRVVTGIIKTQAQLDAYNNQMGYIAPYLGAYQIGDPMWKLDPSTASQGYEAPEAPVLLGNGPPKYYGGMTQGFSYKRFALQCYLTFSHGGHMLWVDHVASSEFDGTANASRLMLGRYTSANMASNEPALSFNTYYYPSNLDVFSSSYLKLRTLTLNYRLDVKKTHIANMQIYISATNLFTHTKYPGSDPETSDDPYSVNGGYVDAQNYPSIRTFSVGLNTTF